jgi:hypothetical protein
LDESNEIQGQGTKGRGTKERKAKAYRQQKCEVTDAYNFGIED